MSEGQGAKQDIMRVSVGAGLESDNVGAAASPLTPAHYVGVQNVAALLIQEIRCGYGQIDRRRVAGRVTSTWW